ncbi:Sporulation related domain-containing protein [Flexibacter flexilis DSM 6793]|uniref:Sporulation related domain-containing protein n=1 Tax=Flexibacter flexilis DSM 6793 TaxID=927664 RepID=A0A1I1L6M7_9BACT|nr:SPOR domain-containing protein [Flexibacter flexilis]SFC68689.1 Sporulation related domain-containing protein [Flexibacter flexilis DSM 6793]
MVEKYIKYLLFNYDCVVIPDLGGFITSYNTAEVHPVRHTFLPPSKAVAFNERLKNDDGLLANTIAKFENISTEEAYFQIKGFVFDIREALKDQNKCYIKEIGTLFINHEYALQFEQDSKNNYENESFGLPELFFKPIIRENVATRLVAASKDRAAATSNRVPAPARRRNDSVWTYILAIPVLAVIALVAVSVYFVAFTDGKQGIAGFNPLQKNSTIAPQETEADDVAMVTEPTEDSATQQETSEPIAAVEPHHTPKKEPKALPKVHQESSMMDAVTSSPAEVETITPTDGSKRYYVIVGSFSKPENAVSLRQRLAISEATAKVIHPSDNRGLYKVSLADYENLTQAQAKLNEAQTRFKESLWVCKY